ncbi:ABC-2 type transport system permease protein [Diaminobutyricimonas aerilata]|uniref:Transport permease protein n=1 Tax=Diaminobutyricimonas aerilata TaxID=1162967 RepID=A0A2M9CH53_9MICO|nr:ABC transporter permease [Diaminobutyricimonas aerilata]PJJ71218.1 ABC-2 type transport system permease protein [Diaminobutyricimonas aerilata]
MSYLTEILSSRELLINLTRREIQGKYKRTIFGQLWSLVNPLAMMLVYTLVFAFILRVQPDPGDPSGIDVFAVWLLCGLLPWTFFSSVVTSGMGSLVGNVGLIQKVYFSRIVLPVSAAASIAFNWAFEMGVLLVVLLVCGAFVLPWIPALIVIMALLAVFAIGIALMLSIANVYFRDTQHLLAIVMQLWLYLTPVIYPISLLESQSDEIGGLWGSGVTLLDIYRLNPMERFTEVFRNVLYDNRWPEVGDVLYCVGAAAVSLAIGMFVFRRNEKKLAEAL